MDDMHDISPPLSQETLSDLLRMNGDDFVGLELPPSQNILYPTLYDVGPVEPVESSQNTVRNAQQQQEPTNNQQLTVHIADLEYMTMPVYHDEYQVGSADDVPPVNSDYENFPGPYGFDVAFNCSSTPVRSAPWTYSSILDQLFTKTRTPCPVQFVFTSLPRFGSVIKARLFFKRPEDMNRPVRRCCQHQQLEPEHPLRQHIIRCEDPEAAYDVQPDERGCVTVPYRSPVGRIIRNLTYNYTFHCVTSCVGGMNRRPVVIMFTLEHGNHILGKRVLNIRMCACPGRDRTHQENPNKERNLRNNQEEMVHSTSERSKVSEKRKRDDSEPTFAKDLKRALTGLNERGSHSGESTSKRNTYYMKVEGSEEYEIMMKFYQGLKAKKSIEKLLNALGPDVKRESSDGE